MATARFYEYVDITARFDSTGTCGHPIKKGDAIGFCRKGKLTQCSSCWTKWTAENAEADLMESQLEGYGY